jgi:hypothetical protein
MATGTCKTLKAEYKAGRQPPHECPNFGDNKSNTLKIWSGRAVNGVECSSYLSGFNDWSSNIKIGPLTMQVSVLADRAPTVRYDDDVDCHEAVCKGCAFRTHLEHTCPNPQCGTVNPPGPKVCQCCGSNLGVCYVNRAKGMQSLYDGSINKPVSDWPDVVKATEIAVRHGGMRLFRFGAFGNVLIMGQKEIKKCADLAHSLGMRTVGYVADWMFYPAGNLFAQYGMASCGLDPDNKKRDLAHKLGWRTYRAKLEDEAPRPGETLCLHESDCVQCMNCGKCGGQDGDIVITLHR